MTQESIPGVKHVEEVRAETVAVAQAVVGKVIAEQAHLEQSHVASLVAETAELNQSAAGTLQSETVTLHQSAVAGIQAETVTLQESAAAAVVASQVTGTGIRCGLLNAERVEGEVTCLIDQWWIAAVGGVAIGAGLALVGLLLGGRGRS